MGRRDEVLDAAITVLGQQGVRELTHRAVDARAGVPAGTASNHFRSREALFDGVVHRLAVMESLAAERVTSPDELIRVLAAFASAAVGERRHLTLARFALLVEAANRPHLQETLSASASGVSAWATALVAAAGSVHPARDAAILGSQVDAMTLHQLAYPDPGYDPYATLSVLVTALLGTR